MAGFWIPYLGIVTCVALVACFLVAIGVYTPARDFRRNLFVNATGTLRAGVFELRHPATTAGTAAGPAMWSAGSPASSHSLALTGPAKLLHS